MNRKAASPLPTPYYKYACFLLTFLFLDLKLELPWYWIKWSNTSPFMDTFSCKVIKTMAKVVYRQCTDPQKLLFSLCHWNSKAENESLEGKPLVKGEASVAKTLWQCFWDSETERSNAPGTIRDVKGFLVKKEVRAIKRGTGKKKKGKLRVSQEI